MSWLQRGPCLLALITLTTADVQAIPVQWEAIDGGNGHYYDLVFPDPAVNWHTAKGLAEQSLFGGVNGHLATITSADEGEFLRASFADQFATDLVWAWIGLTDETAEGKYEWLTGEPVSYTNWRGGEPNNAMFLGWPNGEDHVHYQRIQGNGPGMMP